MNAAGRQTAPPQNEVDSVTFWMLVRRFEASPRVFDVLDSVLGSVLDFRVGGLRRESSLRAESGYELTGIDRAASKFLLSDQAVGCLA